jgi:signal transduction histidine kinase
LLSGLGVDLDLDPRVGMISADADLLRQVLINLTSNARAATEGRASPCVRLVTRAAGEEVVVEVEDNGPGIPVEDRERVFEPYRSKTAGGLGLGLALVKGIVLAHGGSVRVEEGRLGGALLHVELARNPEAPRG